ncbi:hypothetical protein K458DRAFT_390513 [Lentithecium fluviatile CBS 122367]|uniref:Uncharacterized protein n=1 Tax=Lentithecium fluviatile CBS 122367 TaxID=1168545 RepID=A0A6G1IWF4_9PLEO|nr:hypothetical protein K458DRAFT_390513 [Lentithecium fluviatile CBS 122367]
MAPQNPYLENGTRKVDALGGKYSKLTPSLYYSASPLKSPTRSEPSHWAIFTETKILPFALNAFLILHLNSIYWFSRLLPFQLRAIQELRVVMLMAREELVKWSSSSDDEVEMTGSKEGSFTGLKHTVYEITGRGPLFDPVTELYFPDDVRRGREGLRGVFTHHREEWMRIFPKSGMVFEGLEGWMEVG